MQEQVRPQAVIEDLKLPPHSIEAEQAVLGGLLIDTDSLEDVGDMISEEDFYRFDHGLVFSAIKSLADKNQPFDLVTVSEWLENNGQLDAWIYPDYEYIDE